MAEYRLFLYFIILLAILAYKAVGYCIVGVSSFRKTMSSADIESEESAKQELDSEDIESKEFIKSILFSRRRGPLPSRRREGFDLFIALILLVGALSYKVIRYFITFLSGRRDDSDSVNKK